MAATASLSPQNTRTTSIEAYKQILNEGLLSKRRLKIYEILYYFGPLTASEVADRLKGTETISLHGMGSRLSELRNCGVVQERGTKICSLTKRNCILWDVTDKTPLKINKKDKGPWPLETVTSLPDNVDVLVWIPQFKMWIDATAWFAKDIKNATHWMHQPPPPKK